MNINDAQLILDVVHRGSFAEVARDRELDPSWVSRTVGAIEAELGFRIFQRTTRRVVLTEAGDLFLKRMQPIIEAFEEARDEALATTRGPVGTLRMTTTVAFGQRVVVPRLTDFRARYPNVAIDLLLSDANLNLVSERLDLAIRLGPGITGDVVASKLNDTHYHVCASPDYLARHGHPLTPAALSARDCLRFSLPGFRNRWLFRDSNGVVEEVEIGGSLMASGALALHSLVLAGAGPALLANWLVGEDIASGRLIDLFPNKTVTATSFETAVWMIYPSRSFLPQKVRAMIDFLRQEIGTMSM